MGRTQASKLKSRPKMSEIMIENKLSSMLLSDLEAGINSTSTNCSDAGPPQRV